MDLGSELRQARETRGFTLEQLADRTKIRLKHLKAIEDDSFDELPGGLFTRGFLRAYAREVRLDGDVVVSRYIANHEPVIAPPEETASESEPSRESTSAATLEYLDRRGQILGTMVIVLVGTVVYFLLARDFERQVSSSTNQRSLSSVARSGSPSEIVAVVTGGETPPPSGRISDARGLQLEWQPQGTCWVSVRADQQPRVQRLMRTGERLTVDVAHDAVARVGDGAACALSVNGSPAHSLGPSGQPVTVHITKDNYRQFIQ